MPQNKTILLIDAFSSGSHYINAIQTIGHKVIHVISRQGLIKQYGWRRIQNDVTYVANGYDDALAYIRNIRYDHVVCGSEPGIDVYNHLNFPPSSTTYNPPSLGLARYDKFEMNNAIKIRGIEVIPHLISDEISQVISFFQENGRKVVLKPPHSAGSDHVFICETEDQVKQAFSSIYLKRNALDKLNSRVYVQKYIEGQQYIINGICSYEEVLFTDLWRDHRQIISEKKIFDYEELVLDDHPLSETLKNFSKSVLSAVGIINGPFHMEVIEHYGQLLHIEVGSRLMGSMSNHAYETIFNFSPVKAHLEQVISGRLPNALKSYPDYTRCVTLRSFKDGIVSSSLEDTIQKLKTYKGAYGLIKKGSHVTRYKDLFDNLGTLYLSGSRKDVISDYVRIRDLEKSMVTTSDEKLLV